MSAINLSELQPTKFIEDIHQRGVDTSSKLGNHETAVTLLMESLDHLKVQAAEQLPELVTIDPQRALHAYRVYRDLAAVATRVNMPHDDAIEIKKIYDRLDETDERASDAWYQQANNFRREAWFYIQTELGATQGVLGRIGTAHLAVAGESDIAAQDHYELADRLLRDTGGNRYYQTSNAMNGARDGVLRGQYPRAGLWLGRAAQAGAQAALGNRKDAVKSAGTIAHRLPALLTPERARQSVIARL